MNKKAKNFLIQIGLGVLLGLALGGGLAQFEQSYYLGWDILFYFLAFSVIAFISISWFMRQDMVFLVIYMVLNWCPSALLLIYG